MPRIQHKTRRGPGETITVCSTIYGLDEDGVVEVSEEHAALLLQGAKWREEGQWAAWERVVFDTTPAIVSGARRPRSRAEMLALAEAEGVQGASEALAAELQGQQPSGHSEPIMVPEKTSPETPAAKRAAGEGGLTEAETETDEQPVEEITVRESMKKVELQAVAEQMGIDHTGMTKPQILDAIEAQSSEDDEEE